MTKRKDPGEPEHEDVTYETMMSAAGTSPVEEFGRIPPPAFLAEALAEGQRHQQAAEEAVRRRKEKAEMRTVSAKETDTHTERCDQCGLWFEFLHPSADGRFLCRICLELEGGNRAAPLAADFAEETVGRRGRVDR